MTQMSPLICADNGIVQPDGNVVQDNQTTGAFRNGYSVTARTTVEITVMSYPKIVQSVAPKLISNAPTIDAFQSMINSMQLYLLS